MGTTTKLTAKRECNRKMKQTPPPSLFPPSLPKGAKKKGSTKNRRGLVSIVGKSRFFVYVEYISNTYIHGLQIAAISKGVWFCTLLGYGGK